MQIQELLNRLDGVKTNGTNKWIARCPCKQAHAHGDKNRSLTVALNGTKILLQCHTGCTTDDICGAIGIEGKDHAAHTQLRAFEMLDIQEQVTRQFKEM